MKKNIICMLFVLVVSVSACGNNENLEAVLEENLEEDLEENIEEVVMEIPEELSEELEFEITEVDISLFVTENANIYSNADIESEILATYNRKDYLHFIGQTDNGFYVLNYGIDKAYIEKKYLSEFEPYCVTEKDIILYVEERKEVYSEPGTGYEFLYNLEENTEIHVTGKTDNGESVR